MSGTKNGNAVIFTIILAGMILFGTVGTVRGRGRCASSEDAKYYHQMEASYVSQAKSVLNNAGYINSGVTMTHLIDENGARTYIVRLHHERLTEMPPERKEEVFNALTAIDFSDGEVIYEIV